MSDLSVVPDEIRRFGDMHGACAAEICAAAGVDQAAIVAAAVPVFGLIGQDFLAAFVAAQANNLGSVAELGAVHAGTARTAYDSAGLYEATELDSASATASAVRS
ncbi:type VII secretion target [Nocardia sp. NBC_00416]|uniref:type VII secretion target n=1 Tax=Nocardia sp. NBC_00416 TaxID=2975991 RepID=UPI002E1C90FF